jgi:hypothetical protein
MRTLKDEELAMVAGGCGDLCPPPEPTVKGNNGWGNGAEGTNAGSDDGGTLVSKIDETWTAGDESAPSKFDTR